MGRRKSNAFPPRNTINTDIQKAAYQKTGNQNIKINQKRQTRITSFWMYL